MGAIKLGFSNLFCRESVGGKKCPSKYDMNDKVVVITGASSGIGEKTAEEIAKKGFYTTLIFELFFLQVVNKQSYFIY